MRDPIVKPSTLALLIAAGAATPPALAQTLSGSAGSLDPRENAANVDWAYNWGIEPKHDVANANYEFVPMIWSGSPGGVQNQINRINNLEANYGVHVDYVLGFNEPELSTQANMSVQTAINTWDVITNAFENTDVKLVSPAVSGSGAINNWLDPFMAEVNTRNADADPDNDLQVDAIAYHFYTVGYNPQTEATKLLSHIDQLWDDYGLPIWLTEFAGTSFSLDNPVHSVEERTAFNAEFLEILIPEFEARPYLERYAWWQFGAFGRPYSALSTNAGGVYTPTELGEIYSGTTLNAGQTYDLAQGDTGPTEVHYLKGGTLTNTGPALETGLRAIDALQGISELQGDADWGFEVADDAFLRVRSGVVVRKRGTNTITLRGTLVENNGAFTVEAGTLELQGGVSFAGGGGLYVGNGVLSLGKAGDDHGGRVDQAFESQGGTIQANALNPGGQNVIAGPTNLLSTTTFIGQGMLTASGTISGEGGLTKTGNGTLFLTGANSYNGPTTIQGGSILAVNDSGSATGNAAVNVQANGTLGGNGRVGGHVTVHAGGGINPGVAQSNRGLTSPLPAIDPGVVVNAIDFNFTGVQDDAPLTQTATLNPALELIAGLDFGPGVQPRGAANNGNEFNVMGFSTDDEWGGAKADNDYLTFTVAPVAGLAMQLDDVTFQLRRNGAGAATHYRIFTSIDGFNAWNDGLNPLTLAIDSADTTTHTFTASYTGNEAVTGPVEVRIYGWNAGSSFGNTHFYAASLDASFITDPDAIALDPTGVLELGGSYTQLAAGKLMIEIAGTALVDDYDQLAVTGQATLAGDLEVQLLDGFAPVVGDRFTVLTYAGRTGGFDHILGLDIDGNLRFIADYQATGLDLVATTEGDADADGDVDQTDLQVVLGRFGSTLPYGVAGDWDLDGNVGVTDLNAVLRNWTSSTAPVFDVPEPSALAMLLIGGGLLARRRR